MPRLYDTVEGSIPVDDHDVRDATLASVCAAVGVVTQDPHLFHDSIAANLRYARPSATDADLVEACRAARIHDLIVSLPEGYDTVVGERGYRLSGGEKQRLAIARVLLKDPAMVILDEATAHLDSETELLVQQALAEALTGRTSIVIAHRLSTIQAADQILVLEEGQIVARGTHDSLLIEGGLYADLYQTQYLRGADLVERRLPGGLGGRPDFCPAQRLLERKVPVVYISLQKVSGFTEGQGLGSPLVVSSQRRSPAALEWMPLRVSSLARCSGSTPSSRGENSRSRAR